MGKWDRETWAAALFWGIPLTNFCMLVGLLVSTILWGLGTGTLLRVAGFIGGTVCGAFYLYRTLR